MSNVIISIVIITLLCGACSSMSNKEQRMLSGGAMGAGTGLLIGGPVGAIVGGGIGAGGGYAYDQHQKSEGKP
jgi:osmotically inducible lipoprotein OsmB